MAKIKSERHSIMISDDDFLLSFVIENMKNLLSEQNTKKIISLALCCLFDVKGVNICKSLPAEHREMIMSKMLELSIYAEKQKLREMTYYAYGLSNIKHKITDMIIKNVDTKSILKVISDTCKMHRFNPNDTNGWKKISVMDAKAIDQAKARVEMLKVKRHLEGRDIKTLGLDQIMKFKEVKKFDKIDDEGDKK